MAITVNRKCEPQLNLLAPHELESGKSYRRSGGVSDGANYRDVIVVTHVEGTGEKFLLDLKDFRMSPPGHESLRGMSFYESDIIINA